LAEALPCKTQMLQIVTLHGDYHFSVSDCSLVHYQFHKGHHEI